jgi:hypothetical protein
VVLLRRIGYLSMDVRRKVVVFLRDISLQIRIGIAGVVHVRAA